MPHTKPVTREVRERVSAGLRGGLLPSFSELSAATKRLVLVGYVLLCLNSILLLMLQNAIFGDRSYIKPEDYIFTAFLLSIVLTVLAVRARISKAVPTVLSLTAVAASSLVWTEGHERLSLALAAAFVLMVALVVAWPKYTTSSAV